MKGGSLTLYIISFLLPVFSGSDVGGIQAFVFGALVYPVAWFANLLYLLAFVFKKKEPKIIFISLAVFCASTTFDIKEINTEIEFNTHTKVSPGIGFYVWLSSFILLLISTVIKKQENRSPV